MSCPRCSAWFVSWDQRMLGQLADGVRAHFPLVLTYKYARDQPVVSLLRPRTSGNRPTEFHPHTSGKCENKEKICCDGKPYKTRMEITCPFHSLVYGIECHEQTEQVDRLVHPILKRGHSNSVEASHNILLRFRSKDIHLDNLHYELSSNLADL